MLHSQVRGDRVKNSIFFKLPGRMSLFTLKVLTPPVPARRGADGLFRPGHAQMAPIYQRTRVQNAGPFPLIQDVLHQLSVLLGRDRTALTSDRTAITR